MRETLAAFGAALLGVGVVTWGGTAQAQQQQIKPFFAFPGDDTAPASATHPDVGWGAEHYRNGPLAAPSQAFELSAAAGYTQGFGMILPGTGVPSVAGAGIGVNATLAYRMSPHVSLGVMGQYQEFTSENNSASRGTAGNIGFTFHGAPYTRTDPWLRIATGYRLLWSVDPLLANGTTGNTTLIHGFEIGALNLGLDLRLSEGVAISPMVGADLNLFVWQDTAGFSSRLSSAQVATFVFGGIQGRFDAGGSSAARGGTVAASADPTRKTW
jgi:hypothetical protein